MEQKCSVQFFLTTPGGAVFYQHNSKILLWSHSQSGCSMEELFNGQLSFADIEAEKFLQIRRTHADRRVNAILQVVKRSLKAQKRSRHFS